MHNVGCRFEQKNTSAPIEMDYVLKNTTFLDLTMNTIGIMYAMNFYTRNLSFQSLKVFTSELYRVKPAMTICTICN